MLSRIKARTRLLRIPQTRNIVWFRVNSMNLGLPFEYEKDASAEHYFWKFVQQTDCQTEVDHYDGSTVFFLIQISINHFVSNFGWFLRILVSEFYRGGGVPGSIFFL
jgi:hypothetical protein